MLEVELIEGDVLIFFSNLSLIDLVASRTALVSAPLSVHNVGIEIDNRDQSGRLLGEGNITLSMSM